MGGALNLSGSTGKSRSIRATLLGAAGGRFFRAI